MDLRCLNSFDRMLETTHGLETNYLRVLYYEFPRYYQDVYHSYEYPRLCTILNGQKKVSYDGCEPFTYDESQFILLPPDSTVLMEIPNSTQAFVLEFSDSLIKRVSEQVSYDLGMDVSQENEHMRYDFSLTPDVRVAFRNVVSACFGKDRNKEFLMDLHAQELVYHLLSVRSIHAAFNNSQSNPIMKSIGYMTDNWDKKPTVRQLASMANMSVNTYALKFKKLTGMTPAEYRTGIKMSRARDLLRTHSVTTVALELGFENISHFIHLFKGKYGQTPKQFQKHNAGDVENGLDSVFNT